VEAGNLVRSAGFARGNFNYRIEEIGVNFVGTDVRSCSGSSTPSGCYSAAFVPYSMQHLGPYQVRTYEGDDFQVHLFPGRIEQARGLGAERYLSNPLSSADHDLIRQYLRHEFNGRPLDGTFVLRVWDDEGVNFGAIADVQIVLKYRYWTRFK
jgi:hypothetical protein